MVIGLNQIRQSIWTKGWAYKHIWFLEGGGAGSEYEQIRRKGKDSNSAEIK